jgi:hypothetical protein
MGQSLDLLTSKAKKEDGTYDLDTFDMKLYSSIVKYKTSIYSFHLPVALGMHMVSFGGSFKEISNAQSWYLILMEHVHFYF